MTQPEPPTSAFPATAAVPATTEPPLNTTEPLPALPPELALPQPARPRRPWVLIAVAGVVVLWAIVATGWLAVESSVRHEREASLAAAKAAVAQRDRDIARMEKEATALKASLKAAEERAKEAERSAGCIPTAEQLKKLLPNFPLFSQGRIVMAEGPIKPCP